MGVRLTVLVAVIVALLSWGGTAHAQAEGEQVPPPPDDAPVDTSLDSDPEWDSYHAAFLELAAGRSGRAIEMLRALRAERPDHPAAERALTLLEQLDASAAQLDEPGAGPPEGYLDAHVPAPPEAPPQEPIETLGEEQATGTARAELVFFQSLHGLALGVEVCLAMHCEEIQPWVLSLMVGTGAGFGASLFFSSDGVTPGLARALNSGSWWGAWHAGMLGLATEAFDNADDEEEAIGFGLAAGQLLGLGAGGLAYHLLQPRAGDVSLASSGGIWTIVVTLATAALIQPELDDPTPLFWAMLLAGDAGLVAGALLAREVPMTAGRVLLLDAGALLGGLLALGIDLLIEGDDPDPQTLSGMALVGVLGGLGLSYYLSQEWDAPEAPAVEASVSLVPVPGGVAGAIHGRF